jgi:hypothetical protein
MKRAKKQDHRYFLHLNRFKISIIVVSNSLIHFQTASISLVLRYELASPFALCEYFDLIMRT